jgi:outer membrane protein OmpA-like peptidoglycan-associated protein
MKLINPVSLVAPVLLLTFLATPRSARAVDLTFKLEPGFAAALNRPQTDRFDLGGAAALKGMIGLGSYVDATLGIAFLALPTATDSLSMETGTAWAGSAGLRFKLRESEESRAARPHVPEPIFGIKPWIDADAMYVRTGPLNRFGFAAAVGLSVPLGAEDQFWIGPFARYMQIVQGDVDGFDTRDSRTIIIGLSLETGASLLRPTHQEVVSEVSAPPAQAPPPPVGDRDGDGVLDDIDRCPDVPGPASNGGCPVYEKVIVKPDKLELNEKIQFAWNSPVIENVSRPALDEVAKALQENKGFRVQIEGHASSEGGDEHNQTLSEQRAQAVLDYLAGKGVARDRLKSKGFSSSRPVSSNVTETGREANRRVEFVVFFIIVNEGSGQ